MRLTVPLVALAQAQRQTVLLWAPVFLGIGIAVYFRQQVEPSPGFAMAVGFVGLSLLLPKLILRRFSLLALCGLALFGFGVAKLGAERVAAPILAEEYYGPVSGRIVGFDRSQSNKLRIMLDRVHLPGVPPQATPARVRVVLGTAMPE
ncbi:MAG: competence protein, partial [Pseudomonadota bacterium]